MGSGSEWGGWRQVDEEPLPWSDRNVREGEEGGGVGLEVKGDGRKIGEGGGRGSRLKGRAALCGVRRSRATRYGWVERNAGFEKAERLMGTVSSLKIGREWSIGRENALCVAFSV